MRRPTRYSRSPRSSPPTEEVADDANAPASGPPAGEAQPPAAPRRQPGRAALALMLVVAMGAARLDQGQVASAAGRL